MSVTVQHLRRPGQRRDCGFFSSRPGREQGTPITCRHAPGGTACRYLSRNRSLCAGTRERERERSSTPPQLIVCRSASADVDMMNVSTHTHVSPGHGGITDMPLLYPGSRNGDCGLVVWTGLCGWSRGLSVIGAQRCPHRGALRRGVPVSMESESDTSSIKSTTVSSTGSVMVAVGLARLQAALAMAPVTCPVVWGVSACGGRGVLFEIECDTITHTHAPHTARRRAQDKVTSRRASHYHRTR